MEKEVLCQVQFPIYCSETLDEDVERIILNSNTPLTESQIKQILKSQKRKAAARVQNESKARKKEEKDREINFKERQQHHHMLRDRDIPRDYHKQHHGNSLRESMKDNGKQHGRVATKDNTPKEPVHPVREIRERRQLRLTFQSPELRRRFQEVARSVPGRKEQAYRIFDFISMAENGATSPICLHGNTGCGKTSLITKVLDFFAANSKTVQVAYLNCMSMWSTHHVCTGILSKIFEIKQKRNANAVLRERFEQCGRRAGQKTKIIVLDQIDQFINDQHFLYNMLDWLQIRDAKIILVLISNVIDLTLRLNGKLQSRLKFEAVIFKPYSYHQVEEIIYYKYPDIRSLLHRDAITFVSKKIANINSDIRLLERIHTRLINQYVSGGKQLLTVQDVSSLILEENRNPRMMPAYTILTRILHRAVKKEQVSHEIFHRLFLQGSRNPRSDQIVLMLCDLKDSGLITLTSTNRKNSDFTFHDIGIKLREDLHDFIGEDERK